MLATLAPGASAFEPLLKLPVDLPAHLAKGGKVVPPRSGTWVGTYEESSGSQIVKQNRLFDMEELLGQKVDVDHNYTGWNEPFPGWREKWASPTAGSRSCPGPRHRHQASTPAATTP